MLLTYFNRKEYLRHRAVSLRQHGFLVFFNLILRTTYSTYVAQSSNLKSEEIRRNCPRTMRNSSKMRSIIKETDAFALRLNRINLNDFQLHLIVKSVAILVRHETVRLRHGVLLCWILLLRDSRLLLGVISTFRRLALKCRQADLPLPTQINPLAPTVAIRVQLQYKTSCARPG